MNDQFSVYVQWITANVKPINYQHLLATVNAGGGIRTVIGLINVMTADDLRTHWD